MKIAYVIINANRREGTSRAVLEVAERLATQHDVSLIARTAEDVDLGRVRWQRIAGPSWPEVADFGTFVLLANRFLAHSNYDIIHAAGPNCTVADVYTIQTVHPVKCRVIRTVGGHRRASVPRRLTRMLYDKAVVAAERRAYRSRNARGKLAYLPVSAGTRDELLAEYPVQEGLVSVIPNGADLVKFHPSNREKFRSSVRQRHRLSSEDFVLVFSGGDWVRKGLRLAAEALTRITDPRVKLLVVGRDPLENDFRQSVEALGLENRIVFAGFQNAVEEYYAAGDLFVFPTAYEAFSLATIEAAASGLPVLMPEVSGAMELVGNGKTGMMLERTPEAFASAIQELVADVERHRQMGNHARQLTEQRFTWDAIASETELVYKQLLAARQK